MLDGLDGRKASIEAGSKKERGAALHNGQTRRRTRVKSPAAPEAAGGWFRPSAPRNVPSGKPDQNPKPRARRPAISEALMRRP